MTDDDQLPEEEAAMIAADESMDHEMAVRKLMALMVAQIGFLGNVMISIDEKLGVLVEDEESARVH